MNKHAGSFSKEYFLSNNAQLIIQSVDIVDASEILTYLEQIAHETDYLSFGPGESQITLSDEKEFIQAMNSKATNIMLKGVVNNKIVSLLTIQSGKSARQYFTSDLGISVLQDYWGKKIGYYMLQTGIEIAKLRSIAKINLIVRSDNTTAIKLYQKFNFKKEGELTKDIYINDIFYNSLLLGLDLKNEEYINAE